MTPLETLLNRGKELREKASPGPWEAERVDHERSITIEIGPKHDGSFGFRFVLREENYETEHPNGEWTKNIAKMKGDAALIVHAANTLANYEEIIRVLSEALEKVIRIDGNEALYPRGPGIALSALSRAQTLAAQAMEGKVGV